MCMFVSLYPKLPLAHSLKTLSIFTDLENLSQMSSLATKYMFLFKQATSQMLPSNFRTMLKALHLNTQKWNKIYIYLPKILHFSKTHIYLEREDFALKGNIGQFSKQIRVIEEILCQYKTAVATMKPQFKHRLDNVPCKVCLKRTIYLLNRFQSWVHGSKHNQVTNPPSSPFKNKGNHLKKFRYLFSVCFPDFWTISPQTNTGNYN